MFVGADLLDLLQGDFHFLVHAWCMLKQHMILASKTAKSHNSSVLLCLEEFSLLFFFSS